MPCTYTGSLDGDAAMFARDELDVRERMLCALCRKLEEVHGEDETKAILRAAARSAKGLHREAIVKWWRDHKKADEARK